MKSAIKNETEVTLNHSSNIIGDSNDEKHFPYKLLLANTQVSKLRKAFPNNSSADKKLWKTELDKIGKQGGILGRLLAPLLKTGLHLMGNVLKALAKSVLMPLGLTKVTSEIDTALHEKMFGSGFATSIISNKKWKISWKKSLENSSLLIKGVSGK